MDRLRNKDALYISIGAIFGALSRYYLTAITQKIMGHDVGFIATFGINILGCGIIAYILTLVKEGDRSISPELKLMTTTGFCGAFTTFSTYALETVTWGIQGKGIMILLYGMGTLVVGMIGIQLGVFLARLKIARQE